MPLPPASKKLKCSYNSVLGLLLCIRIRLIVPVKCLQAVASHLFMRYFVNASLISLSELVETQILYLRLAYPQKHNYFFLVSDNSDVQ